MSPELGNKLRFTFKTITLVLMLIAIPVIAFIVGIMAVQVSSTAVATDITGFTADMSVADAFGALSSSMELAANQTAETVSSYVVNSNGTITFTFINGGYSDQPLGLILGGFLPFIILTLVSGSL